MISCRNTNHRWTPGDNQRHETRNNGILPTIIVGKRVALHAMKGYSLIYHVISASRETITDMMGFPTIDKDGKSVFVSTDGRIAARGATSCTRPSGKPKSPRKQRLSELADWIGPRAKRHALRNGEKIMDMPQYLRISDVTFHFGISRALIYRLIKEGKLEAVKCGRSTRIPTASVTAHFANLPKMQSKAA